MTEAEYLAFLDAWNSYPSRENEVPVLERGSFKAGFLAGISYKEAELKELKEQWALQWNDEAAANAAGYNEAFEKFRSEMDRLTKENARLRDALEQIAHGDVAQSSIKGYLDEAYQQIAVAALEEKSQLKLKV